MKFSSKEFVAFLRGLSGTHITYGVVALALVVGGGYYVLVPSAPKYETLVVRSGNFSQQVSLSGKVVAAQNVDLGFDQSGRVSRVAVRVGDTVSAGTVLASVENGDTRAALLQREAALETQRAKLLSLTQGTRPEEVAIARSGVVSAEAALDQANIALVNALQSAYTQVDDALHTKEKQYLSGPRSDDSGLAVSIENNRQRLEDALTLWKKNLANLSPTADSFTSSILEAQTNLTIATNLLNDISSALSALSGSNTNAIITAANLTTYISNTSTARTNVNTALSTLTTAVTAQRTAASALISAEDTLRLKQAGATQSDIDAQTAQVKAALADVASAQAQLAKTLIVAPFSGVVTKMDAKVGQIVSPSTSLISMISRGTFQIESYVPEVNIANIQLGNPANVTLDAYSTDVQFPASVVSIDPGETIRDGVSTYKVVLQFGAADPRILSGMTANVNITTKESANTLSVPQGIVVSRDGKKYLQILVGKEVVEREVTVGEISSLGQIQILSGLSDGDTVILPPIE